MGLLTVFIIIALAILLLVGILWLLSLLLGSRKEKDELAELVAHSNDTTAAPEPEEDSVVPEPAVTEPEPVAQPDDLKVIEGIGPKITEVLNETGIYSFAHLAAMKLINLEVLLKEANIRIANPSTWAEQAALAAEGKWDELHKLQDELKGGRKVA